MNYITTTASYRVLAAFQAKGVEFCASGYTCKIALNVQDTIIEEILRDHPEFERRDPDDRVVRVSMRVGRQKRLT